MEWSGRRPTRFKRPDSAGARPRMMGLAQSSGATRTTLSREPTLRNQLATMFGFTSTTQVTHSQCQAHPLPVSRSFACSPTRLVNRFQSKGCRCAPMRSRQSCTIMYHGERCSSCRNATCVASTALRVLAPRRRLAAGSIVASKHASRAETRVKSRNKKYNTHSPKDLITPAGAARARHYSTLSSHRNRPICTVTAYSYTLSLDSISTNDRISIHHSQSSQRQFLYTTGKLEQKSVSRFLFLDF